VIFLSGKGLSSLMQASRHGKILALHSDTSARQHNWPGRNLHRVQLKEISMSQEAVYGFIDKINRDTELATIVAKAITEQSATDLVNLAGRHGFNFTEEEGLKAWQEIQASGELPEALLDAVAGGAGAKRTGETGGS